MGNRSEGFTPEEFCLEEGWNRAQAADVFEEIVE